MKLQLMKKTKDELKELTKLYGIKGVSKLNKEGLCDVIVPIIVEQAKEWYTLFNEAQLSLVDKLVEAGKVTIEDKERSKYKFLENIGFITLSDKENEIVLPEEIRNEYKKYDKGQIQEVEEKRAQYMNLRQYALASTHLYGAVEITHLSHLYEKYEGQKLDLPSFLEWLNKESHLMRTYIYMEDYLVSECLYYFELKGFKELVAASEGKEYYVPSRRDEFMRYSNENYYEPNLHIEKLRAHLKRAYRLDEQTVETAIFELYLGGQISTNENSKTMQQILSEWNLMGIMPHDLKEINDLVTHVVKVMNSTRMWLNKGYKIEELQEGENSRPISREKVGRNESCPCGSGKKYKKCCGR